MDDITVLVRRLAEILPPAAARVARHLDQNRAQVLASSAAQIAAHVETSDATVIRVVQALGFQGLPDFKKALAAELDEQVTPAANLRRTLATIGDTTIAAIETALDAHREGLDALQSRAGKGGIVAAVKVLHPASRIGIFGIGPSAHLARYAALQLVRTGRQSLLLDATGRALADQLLGLCSGDAIMMLAYGRPYREAQAVMSEARRLGLPIVLVTDTATHAMARHASAVLLAQRGRTAQVAQHATTLAALEAVALGLAAADREGALAQLVRLDRLRKLVGTTAGEEQTRHAKADARNA